MRCDSALFHSIQKLIFPETQPTTIWRFDLTSVQNQIETVKSGLSTKYRSFLRYGLWTPYLALSMSLTEISMAYFHLESENAQNSKKNISCLSIPITLNLIRERNCSENYQNTWKVGLEKILHITKFGLRMLKNLKAD